MKRCGCRAEMVRQHQGAVVIGPDVPGQAYVCLVCDRGRRGVRR